MSTIKMADGFVPKTHRLATALHQAAETAMDTAMMQAANDARELARWRDEGEHAHTDDDGNLWVWEVSDVARKSITGFIVTPTGDTFNAATVRATTTRRSVNGYDFPPHVNDTDPSLVEVPAARVGEIIGVVTMYPEYVKYLQSKETNGAVWGIPAAGMPVTIEVLYTNWHSHYVPRIVAPYIEKRLKGVR